MIHFSCDRCRRTIDTEDLRFAVSIEIQVALESSPLNLDPSLDSVNDLEALQEALSHFDEQEREEISQFAYQQKQFDLCSDCHREYLSNPLGVEPHSRVGFSEN